MVSLSSAGTSFQGKEKRVEDKALVAHEDQSVEMLVMAEMRQALGAGTSSMKAEKQQGLQKSAALRADRSGVMEEAALSRGECPLNAYTPPLI
ncbi:CS1 fimbrial subunit B [Dissostichus eleginoides]|uniref:CS1 fimbrial subunit B n=1 Tax=Dissostichus eleginoides TaxID=100907 RepID=A0AAD9F6T7_DISEL|nr:CS1 fimbrial subunit B [Dissostichus eleginoides]